MDKAEAIKRIKDHIMVHHIGEYPHIKIGEALSMAISALATDNNVGRWIPVTERLPEKGAGKVLVVKQYRGKPYIEVGEVIDGNAYCYSDDYCINGNEHKFTHWMPLPEPPKEVE